MKKAYIIFDSRYHSDPDSATVLEFCDTKKEAETNALDYGDNNVIVEFDVIENELLNPKIIN